MSQPAFRKTLRANAFDKGSPNQQILAARETGAMRPFSFRGPSCLAIRSELPSGGGRECAAYQV
jgi:hypothetical protein